MVFRLLSFSLLVLVSSISHAVQITREIPYTYDGQQALDLYVPENEEISGMTKHPAAIVMHAGGWVGGVRHDMEDIALYFARKGFVVINVDYALAPEKKWPMQIADVSQGVWWLKENAERYHINPDKIVAVGASAGGHLAAMLGQYSVNSMTTNVNSEIHGIISFSGPWNLLEAKTEEQVYYVNMLLSVDTIQARYLASPLFLISKHSPPVLILHGTADELVPFKQSKRACELYKSKGLDSCIIIPLEGFTHHSGVIDMDNGSIAEAINNYLNWWLVH